MALVKKKIDREGFHLQALGSIHIDSRQDIVVAVVVKIENL